MQFILDKKRVLSGLTSDLIDKRFSKHDLASFYVDGV